MQGCVVRIGTQYYMITSRQIIMEGIHIQFQWIPFQRDILKNMFYDWQAGEKGEFIKLRTFTCILCPVIIVKFPIVFEISRTKGANSALSY